MGGSGSGSSSFTGSGGGGRSTGKGMAGAGAGSPKFDCSAFQTRASLRSPKKDVIDSLNVGDILDLRLTEKKPPVLAVTQDGEVAGSIVIPERDDLVKCMNKGTEYVAEVMSIEGGSCIVHVYAWEDD